MLSADDVDTIREVLGDAVLVYEDASLIAETRLAITQEILLDAVPGALAETDPGRIRLIDAAQAYLIGMDLIASAPVAKTSRLGESELQMDPARYRDILTYWGTRYRALTGRLNASQASPVTYFTLASGRRG